MSSGNVSGLCGWLEVVSNGCCPRVHGLMDIQRLRTFADRCYVQWFPESISPLGSLSSLQCNLLTGCLSVWLTLHHPPKHCLDVLPNTAEKGLLPTVSGLLLCMSPASVCLPGFHFPTGFLLALSRCLRDVFLFLMTKSCDL